MCRCPESESAGVGSRSDGSATSAPASQSDDSGDGQQHDADDSRHGASLVVVPVYRVLARE